jgi:cytochrome c oxidase assembly protein subunit 15
MLAIGLATSRGWLQSSPGVAADERKLSLRTLSTWSVAAVWVQLILGAAFRHSGIRLLPHIICAGVVTVLLLWTVVRALPMSVRVPALATPAKVALSLLVVQLVLGFAAYVARVQWSADAPQPLAVMVVTTVAHVAVGALLLGASLIMAIQVRRHLRPAEEAALDRVSARQAVSA